MYIYIYMNEADIINFTEKGMSQTRLMLYFIPRYIVIHECLIVESSGLNFETVLWCYISANFWLIFYGRVWNHTRFLVLPAASEVAILMTHGAAKDEILVNMTSPFQWCQKNFTGWIGNCVIDYINICSHQANICHQTNQPTNHPSNQPINQPTNQKNQSTNA